MVIRYFYKTILCLLLMALPFTAFAKVSATVDRAIIEQGETFELTIRSDDDSPELDVLSSIFKVLGTAQSSNISFVNGKVHSEKKWIVTLMPKKEGISIIPSIFVGNEQTDPIRVQVVKAKAVNAEQGADIFLEVSFDTNIAYVQSEVIYTARLFRAVEIREGSLTEPEINSAVVERMGEDVTFQTTRNNRRYQVTERKFALFPQKSGNLAVPPTVFDGQIISPRQARRSADPFDRLFQQQRTRRVQIKSDALVLEVLPEPTDFSGDNWLPAKRLVLTESWSVEPPVFKVGEPITRTLKIQAIGQTGPQLPEFIDFPINGIKQYKDQPSVETGLSEGSLGGIREEKYAIIPTTSGRIVLPEVRLFWWDTELDREQVSIIPPRIIDVAAADIVENETKTIAKEEEEILEEAEPLNVDNIKAQLLNNAGIWPMIALALGIAWLLTIFLWVFHAKRLAKNSGAGSSLQKRPSQNDEKQLKDALKKLKQACSANNPNEAKAAILAWAKIVWPEQKTQSLISVGEYLQDSSVLQAVIDLDELLYSHVDLAWDGQNFWTQVAQRLKKPRHKESGKIKSLPSLYPQ